MISPLIPNGFRKNINKSNTIKDLEERIELNYREFQSCASSPKQEVYKSRIINLTSQYKQLTGRYYRRI